MPIPDPASLDRLETMGIAIWRLRGREVGAGEGSDLRIRLASGHGDWLLVTPDPGDGRHHRLIADITATIGIDRCRFGHWSDSAEAGVSLAELVQRGIEHVLVLGSSPTPIGDPRVAQAPALDELAESGVARRRLWAVLKPYLESD